MAETADVAAKRAKMEEAAAEEGYLLQKPFASVQGGPPDPILGVTEAFERDPETRKVDLGVGAYRTNEGKHLVYSAVRKAEELLSADPTISKEYLPSEGLVSLAEPTRRLVFGGDSAAVNEKRICSVQSLSGTGALHLAADFLRLHVPHIQDVLISKPSWSNHAVIFGRMGFTLHDYPFWNATTLDVDVEGMVKFLGNAPRGALVILHTCAHNPTGMDPSMEQWKLIMNVVKERQLLPLLDTAYNGFATGSLEDDGAPIRLFEAANIPLIVTQSFAKIFGLYGERVGMLHIVCSDADEAARVLSQVKRSARATYSNPPLHGALIVDRILKSPELVEEWRAELKDVSGRIASMRRRLVEELERRKTPGTWGHIARQIGTFSFTGLTPAQCERMTSKWHIYLLKNGRISVAGLNEGNVEYVAEAMDDCVRNA